MAYTQSLVRRNVLRTFLISSRLSSSVQGKEDGSTNVIIDEQAAGGEDLLTSLQSRSCPTMYAGDRTLRREVNQSKNSRHPTHLLLEGRRLVTDCIAAGAIPYKILFTHRHLLEGIECSAENLDIYFVHSRILRKWSDTETPSGLLALVHPPNQRKLRNLSSDCKFSLILDNVRDPGNMGSLIRTAAAFGAREVITMEGCSNPWAPKVLRSAMSAHFRVPIRSHARWEEVVELLDPEAPVMVAEARRGADDDDDDDAVAPPDVYHGTDFAAAAAGPPFALVLGGETHGVSDEARELCQRSGGSRLVIPMRAQVDSLNVAVAGAVLLGEIRRQIELADPALTELESE